MGNRGHNRYRPKRGGCCAPFVGEVGGELGPYLTPRGLGQGVLPYQVASSSIQPFGHNRHGAKIGWGLCPFLEGWAGSRSNTVAWAEAYFHTQQHLGPSSRLVTTDIGRKLGGCAPLGEEELGPHLTQCRLSWGLPPYQVVSWCLQLFGYNRDGRKIGGGSAPFFGRGAGSPSNTMLPRPRPTSVPSGILSHRAVWRQQTWAENWGCCAPFGEGWVPT